MATVRAIVDADIDPSAAIGHAKLNHRFRASHKQDPASAIVAKTDGLAQVRGATGTILAFRATIIGTIATGADRTVDVDLQKSTGAGAFATVLSSTIHFTNASTLRLTSTATLSSTAVQAGDVLQVVVTVAGAAGNQALGLIAEVDLAETPA